MKEVPGIACERTSDHRCPQLPLPPPSPCRTRSKWPEDRRTMTGGLRDRVLSLWVFEKPAVRPPPPAHFSKAPGSQDSGGYRFWRHQLLLIRSQTMARLTRDDPSATSCTHPLGCRTLSREAVGKREHQDLRTRMARVPWTHRTDTATTVARRPPLHAKRTRRISMDRRGRW